MFLLVTTDNVVDPSGYGIVQNKVQHTKQHYNLHMHRCLFFLYFHSCSCILHIPAVTVSRSLVMEFWKGSDVQLVDCTAVVHSGQTLWYDWRYLLQEGDVWPTLFCIVCEFYVFYLVLIAYTVCCYSL